MVPENGYPAVFGFNYEGFSVVMYASVVYTPAGYDLQVTVPGVPRAREPEGASLTFFGDPAERDGGSSPPAAFFANPVDCSAGPLKARIEANSWLEPNNWQSKEATVYPQVTGCDMLQFNPTFEMKPETTEADTPSGYELDLSVPQARNLFPDLATPDLKDATVTLPEGVSIAPSAADGLVGCEATGSEGIDFPNHTRPDDEELHPNEAGEGEETGADGLCIWRPATARRNRRSAKPKSKLRCFRRIRSKAACTLRNPPVAWRDIRRVRKRARPTVNSMGSTSNYRGLA